MSIQHVNLSMNTTASALNTTYGLAAMNENRIQIQPDGTIHLAEKPVAYVIGERIVAPVIDRTCTIATVVFDSLKQAALGIHHFQLLPGAAAQETDGDTSQARDSWIPAGVVSAYHYGRRMLWPNKLEKLENKIEYLLEYVEKTGGVLSRETLEHVITTSEFADVNVQWFKQAMHSNRDSVLRTDFLDDQSNIFKAKLDLLIFERFASKLPNYGKFAAALGEFSELYPHYRTFLNKVTMSVTDFSYRMSLVFEKLSATASRTYLNASSSMSSDPRDYKISAKQMEPITHFREEFSKELQDVVEAFLTKVQKVERSIQSVLEDLGVSHKGLGNAIGKINTLNHQKEDLKQKREKKFRSLSSYGDAMKKEADSRRIETTIKWERFGWWTVHSSRHDKIVTDDYGSQELKKEWLESVEEEKAIERKIEHAEKELANEISKVFPLASNKEDLEQAKEGLAGLMGGVLSLKEMLTARMTSFETSVGIFSNSVSGSGDIFNIDTLHSLQTDLATLAGVIRQLHGQKSVNQAIQKLELELRSGIHEDLLNNTGSGLEKVKSMRSRIEGNTDLRSVLLPSKTSEYTGEKEEI